MDIQGNAFYASLKSEHTTALLPGCLVHCLYSLPAIFRSASLGQDPSRCFKKRSNRPCLIARKFLTWRKTPEVENSSNIATGLQELTPVTVGWLQMMWRRFSPSYWFLFHQPPHWFALVAPLGPSRACLLLTLSHSNNKHSESSCWRHTPNQLQQHHPS